MAPIIKNIYYMLSYAFQSLNQKGYNKLDVEEFENISDLFAEILIIAINKQIKQGFFKDYEEINETTSSIKGNINITESINSQCFLKKELSCYYDEFSVNNKLNQIIKTTIIFILKSDIETSRKKKLRKILPYFSNVNLLDISSINWKLRYNQNNQNYRMIISICYLTLKGLIHKKTDGSYKLMDFIDEQQMNRLYEKFILNYFIKEHPKIKTHSPQIKWQLDDDEFYLLPRMQTDVTLEYGNKILIIDTKYYSKTTQNNYNTNKIHSNNLYQIFTYVKNKNIEFTGEVNGMLLYAEVEDDLKLNQKYMMSGNEIEVKTINLNCDFKDIKTQLDNIIFNTFLNYE